MHSGFTALRSECSMDLKQNFPGYVATPETLADVTRIDALWSQARDVFGTRTDVAHEGPFLFGAFGAADAMYAPVVTRLRTYNLPMSDTARAYAEAVAAHPWMVEWTEAAKAETYPFARYLKPNGVPA